MSKHNNKSNPSKTALIITVSAVALVIVLIGLRFVLAKRTGGDADTTDSVATSVSDFANDSSESSDTAETTATPITVDAEGFTDYVEGYEKEETSLAGIDIGHGLTLISVGSFDGPYVEDGTDDLVENCLSAVVMNTGTADIVTAEVFIEAGTDIASFKVTTLPVGASVTVLEQTRMTYREDIDYTNATSATVAYFEGGVMNARTDIFEFSGGDGFVNLKNVGSADVSGNVTVYYKPIRDGQYFGGITYSARANGGIPAGATQTVQTGHFNVESCRIMFVNIEDSAN